MKRGSSASFPSSQPPSSRRPRLSEENSTSRSNTTQTNYQQQYTTIENYMLASAYQQQQPQQQNSEGPPPSRTVYVGNLQPDTTLDQLLSLIQVGAIENCRFLAKEKFCAFIDFIEPNAAYYFHQSTLMQPVILNGNELKFGLSKPTPINSHSLAAIQAGATRNVYFGGIEDYMTEEYFRSTMERFGLIDTIRVLMEKRIAFVHFACISNAIAAIETLSNENEWTGKKLHFGKDRCSGPSAITSTDPSTADNRTVYFGGISSDTRLDEICSLIKGGLIYSIKIIAEKNCAFVTFVDSATAYLIISQGTYQGFQLYNHNVKVNWGKSTQIPSAMIVAIFKGATRNLYLNLHNLTEKPTREQLNEDFSKFGEIESINILKDREVAFVNFASISSAVSALQELKKGGNHPIYGQIKMQYGRDKCAEPNPFSATLQAMTTYNAYQTMLAYQQAISPVVNTLPPPG